MLARTQIELARKIALALPLQIFAIFDIPRPAPHEKAPAAASRVWTFSLRPSELPRNEIKIKSKIPILNYSHLRSLTRYKRRHNDSRKRWKNCARRGKMQYFLIFGSGTESRHLAVYPDYYYQQNQTMPDFLQFKLQIGMPDLLRRRHDSRKK